MLLSKLNKYIIFANVTFFKQQSFFPVAQPNLQSIDQVLPIPFYSPSLPLKDLPISSSTDPPLLTYHHCPRLATGANQPTKPTLANSLFPLNILLPRI